MGSAPLPRGAFHGGSQCCDGVVPAFSPSSDQVYVNVIDDHSLLVLDAATLNPARAPIELRTPVLGLVPHPDDGSVFAFGQDGAVLRVVPGTGAVASVAPPGTFPAARTVEADVSQDGTRFLAPNLNSDDTEVQLVDATTWERFGAAATWDERFGTFDLSPDGTQFVSLHSDRLAPFDGRTWTVDTRPDSWLDRACAIAGRNLSREEWKEHFPGRVYEITCAQWPAGS